jgi:hypothetical protein
MVIDGYSIGGYWCLLMTIILMAIGGYWWLLIGIILVAIVWYYINDYWWLFCYKQLVVIDGILLMVINGYCIISYCWFLYDILQLLLIIVL